MGLVCMGAGEQFQARVKYFDYGVVSVELKPDFEADWDDLVRLSSRLLAEPEFDKRTAEIVRGCVERDVRELAERTDNSIKFHQARAFILEVMVVAILVIELIDVFGRR